MGRNCTSEYNRSGGVIDLGESDSDRCDKQTLTLISAEMKTGQQRFKNSWKNILIEFCNEFLVENPDFSRNIRKIRNSRNYIPKIG